MNVLLLDAHSSATIEGAGTLYREGMVYVGGAGRIVHTPASVEQVEELMDELLAFERDADIFIR